MTTTHFQEVVWYASKTGPCSVCGKRTRRERKFWQTVNPWNVGADGFPKDRSAITAELKVEAAAWRQESVTHAKCAPTTGQEQ